MCTHAQHAHYLPFWSQMMPVLAATAVTTSTATRAHEDWGVYSAVPNPKVMTIQGSAFLIL